MNTFLGEVVTRFHFQWILTVKHSKGKNELSHLFEVNPFDHKDDVQPELRAKEDSTHIALHRQTVEAAVGLRIG